jgi:hypothetical protein
VGLVVKINKLQSNNVFEHIIISFMLVTICLIVLKGFDVIVLSSVWVFVPFFVAFVLAVLTGIYRDHV